MFLQIEPFLGLAAAACLTTQECPDPNGEAQTSDASRADALALIYGLARPLSVLPQPSIKWLSHTQDTISEEIH